MKVYGKHDSMSVSNAYKVLPEYANDAILLAYDGCHRIYMAMDEEQADIFRDSYDIVVEASSCSCETLVAILKEWYESSCFLKFISAVWTNDAKPHLGFVHIISQGADD